MPRKRRVKMSYYFIEMIKQCFSSNEYKKIMNKRIKNVDSRAIIVPGLEAENESTSDKNWFSGNGASKEVCICVYKRMGITLMTLSFYLTLENPDIIRAELTEQNF